MSTIFRPWSSSDGLRSDRSAGDRHRHRRKLRQAIRENIADIIAEESIIGRSGDRIVKVPIRGIREYQFVYGDNNPGVASGDGDSKKGQKVGKAGQGDQPGQGPGGDQPGVDYYETDVSLEELVDIMFEDLQLPDLERKKLRNVTAESLRKRKGYRRKGIRVHLDKKRTARSRVKRRLATRRVRTELGEADPGVAGDAEEQERFPFRIDDLRYRRLSVQERPQSNAVVICIMDTSGSMDTMKKYLARSFFFLLYQFVRTRYNAVEVVFVAHDTKGKEVTEEEFFSKGQSGGTRISAGYEKAIEIIQDRYHPELWNVYAFHCSDGDNFSDDNDATIDAARELCEVCNLFGYGEIKPSSPTFYAGFYSSSMMKLFEQIEASNFSALSIEGKHDLWPAFKKLLARDAVAA